MATEWTVSTVLEHVNAIRECDRQTDEWKYRFYEERDRRYTEVATEREKALAIARNADRDALGIARSIQDYKDEKANNLREQLGGERNLFATFKDLDPIRAFMSSQTGSGLGRRELFAWVATAAAIALAFATYFK